jgi:hypothetical protein
MSATALPGGYGRALPFTLGLLSAFAAVLALGEGFAHLQLPSDVRQNLGEGLTGSGIHKSDPVLGADYRSYEDFRANDAPRLAKLGPLDAPTPTWLFLGNSFVQAPGMLADTAQASQPDKRIVSLGKNVDLPLRVAQARLLLRAGLRPQRVFFVMLPIDLLSIGSRPLGSITVTPGGLMSTRVRWPDPPWGQFVRASRLATIVWMRSGRAVGDPGFRPRLVDEIPSPRIQADLIDMLGVLSDISREFGVPVTVVTIPDREQIFAKAGFGLQATMLEICKRMDLDFYDARRPFVEASDKMTLFEPDWHFSARGNALLLEGLLDHLKTAGRHAAP